MTPPAYDWKHAALTFSGVATAACEGIAQAAGSGMPLPWHLAAGTFLAAAIILGHVSSSLSAPTGKATP